MAPKMDKSLLAQLKAERAKQPSGGGAPKRKSSRLQKELNVESFLDADLSKDPSLDLGVELLEVDGGEVSKRKAKGTVVGGTPVSKKMKTVASPSTLANFQEALERASGLLCAADKDAMAEMSLQAVGELMLVEMAMATARGRFLVSQSLNLGKQMTALSETNSKLSKQSAAMVAELRKLTTERDSALKSKRASEEERDTAVATAQSLELKILDWDKEMEKYKSTSLGMLEKVKNARRDAIELFLQPPEYRQEITQQYFDGFEAMRSRAALAFPDLDFSKFEIDDEEGPSCLDEGQKGGEEGDEVVSKDTSVPSSSIASLLSTPEKVSLDLETPIQAVTPLGPSSSDGQAINSSTPSL